MSEKSGNSGLAFIVGGLVVAVGFLAWFAFGGGEAALAGGNNGDTTSVTISTEGGDSGSSGSSDNSSD